METATPDIPPLSVTDSGSGPARDPLFRVRELTKVYPSGETEIRALDGVDLELYEGELIVLLGASGSGKSTLLNILGGLDVPSSGQLTYRDLDLTHATENDLTLFRRDSVGFIFQFFNLSPSLTARENVELITEIADEPMDAREALDRVGLSARMDHFPAELSGGEQQRVAVARAIAKRPEILFCDEPTGSLDSASGVKVLEAITQVSADVGATTMIVTHNAVVADIAHRVLRFCDGAVTGIQKNAERKAAGELVW